MDMIAFDLCVLGSCNHSIITYGTFGTWGALFAGGDVIAPTGTNPEAKTEVKSFIFSQLVYLQIIYYNFACYWSALPSAHPQLQL